MDTTPLNPTPQSGPRVLSKTALICLLIGSIQGLFLYLLSLSVKGYPRIAPVWPGSNPYIFTPLLLICVIVPILLILSLGRLHRRPMAIWMLTAVIVLALLGIYDVWRRDIYDAWRSASGGFFFLPVPTSSPSLYLCLFPGFFIAHSLVLAGASDRKWIASYTAYNEAGSGVLARVLLPFGFVLVLWEVLWLGSKLFSLIDLDFLKDLLEKKWFSIPLTCVAFPYAMHIADALPTTAPHSMRVHSSPLLSWIFLIAVVSFSSLLWIGPTPLRGTVGGAALVLLGPASTLIPLICLTVEDATSTHNPTRWIRLYVYVATLASLLLTALAIYVLQFHVSIYGWTSNRIFMAASIFVVACFAIGYALAVCRRDWQSAWLARVNIAMLFIIVGVLLALASPILDPARLSVNNQMARLSDGRIKADKFDFDYLKYEGKHFGMAALNELKTMPQGADAATIREKAEITLKKKPRWKTPR